MTFVVTKSIRFDIFSKYYAFGFDIFDVFIIFKKTFDLVIKYCMTFRYCKGGIS